MGQEEPGEYLWWRSDEVREKLRGRNWIGISSENRDGGAWMWLVCPRERAESRTGKTAGRRDLRRMASVTCVSVVRIRSLGPDRLSRLVRLLPAAQSAVAI